MQGEGGRDRPGWIRKGRLEPDVTLLSSAVPRSFSYTAQFTGPEVLTAVVS